MNTPDTEWREALEGRLFAYLGAMNMLGVMEGKTTDGTIVQRDKAVDDILQIVQTLLTSRDTYWKERVRKEVEWQPIETAPKDGTHILVINLDTPEWNRVPTVAHWFELSVGDETRGNFFLSWNKNADDADYQMNTITHWKALDTLLDNLK